MTKKNALLLFSAVFATSFAAKAQTPFPTGTSVVIAKPGTNTAPINYKIYTNTTPSSGIFVPGANVTTSANINGIGLNQMDNLVYGAAFTGNSNNINTAFDVSLYRIGSDGATVDLGKLPTSGVAGAGAIEFVNFSAGVVGTNGNYYYTTFAIKAPAVTRILNRQAMGLPPDLTAADMRMFYCWKSGINVLPPNSGNNIAGGVTGFYELDFSDVNVTAGINAFLAQVNAAYPNVYDADGGLQDIAINPANGQTYGYMSYPSGGSTVGRPVIMGTPVAGVAPITPVGSTVNTMPGQEIDGLQFDATGNLYGIFTTGDYAQINLSTGALVGLTPSNVTTSGGNLRGDMASIIPTPLPIKLLSFTGKNTGNTNELTWVTVKEDNNKDFTIERSENSKTWSAIGVVNSKAPAGNSSERLSYSFIDNTPSGTEYYRLKQSDRDGKITYSSNVVIQSKATSSFSIYPNPASTNIQISGVHAGSTIRVADVTGKLILEQVAKNEGSTTTVDLSTLAKNIYIVQIIENGAVVHTEKVIKK
jgi:hypothetical protein